MNREDDTIDLLYDDGDFESHVPRERLHAVSIELTDRHACSQPSHGPLLPPTVLQPTHLLAHMQPHAGPLATPSQPPRSPLQPPTAPSVLYSPYSPPPHLLAASTPSAWATWSRLTSKVTARGTPAVSSPSIPNSASLPSSTRLGIGPQGLPEGPLDPDPHPKPEP